MDDFIDQLLPILEDMIANGEDIPDELFGELAAIMEELISREPPPQVGIPEGADLLWILSGGNPDAFVQYLNNIPDPALNELADNPLMLQQVMDQLERQITMPAGEVEQGIPRAGLQSSNVYGFQYDPRTGTLRVRFQGDGVYQYEGVPPYIFKTFQAGAIPAHTNGQNEYGRWWIGKRPSLGASFYELIRNGGYPYQKVA